MHRTPKNIYILNLGISGISTAIICIPPTLIQCLYGGKWYFGLIACKLMPAMQGTNILVSSGTITAIAIDRWLSITQVSNGLPSKLSHTKVCLINVSIWLVSFVIASPILVFQTIENVDLPWTSYTMCVEVWPTPIMKNTFTIIILCVQYLLPLIVLPVVHSKVFTIFHMDMLTTSLQQLTLVFLVDIKISGGKFWFCVGCQAAGKGAEAESQDDSCPLLHRCHFCHFLSSSPYFLHNH